MNHIIPLTTATKEKLKIAMDCIESAIVNSEKQYALTLIDNDPMHSAELNAFASSLFLKHLKYGQYTYIIRPSYFNMNESYNLGKEMSGYTLQCYSNMDVLFHSGWHREIKRAFDSTDRYCCISPITLSTEHFGLCFTNTTTNNYLLTECDHPPGWCMVHNYKHKWDERFDYWEQDCDYWNHLKVEGKKAAICHSSVIEHLQLGICTNNTQSATELLKKKWG